MTTTPDPHDPRVQERLTELQGRIRHSYPAATFTVAHGDDPEGLYLTATVDVEDLDAVTALVLDRLIEIQVDEGLPIYVIPDQPPARVLARLREKAPRPVAALLPSV